jgi:hypothetical protein
MGAKIITSPLTPLQQVRVEIAVRCLVIVYDHRLQVLKKCWRPKKMANSNLRLSSPVSLEKAA